ncbi:acyltransferase family protein [bacterium]|nr:acyltransferase family protein [bacterium]
MTTKYRIESIDILRGVAMLLMVLDHCRVYFGHGDVFSRPTDLSSAPPILFFMRWITHPGAPAFVFLSGTAAYLYGTRHGIQKLPRFLITRGLWLIIVEITIVTFGWTFDITFSQIILQVIWTIGIGMVSLAVLIRFPTIIILAFGLAIVLGHNVLDSIRAQGTSGTDLIWYILHQPHNVVLDWGVSISFRYPLLPWIALMSLGYVFGILYGQGFDSERRKRWLIGLGIGCIVLFVLLRGLHMQYRGMEPGIPDTMLYYLMTFINTSKYPPSVFFMLMSMGFPLLFLAYIERVKNWMTDALSVIGRVPFLFYILHLYVIHLIARVLLFITGDPTEKVVNFYADLGVILFMTVLVIAILYPICKWYGYYKARHREKWWLSYL